jgi:NTP pyrophosphatase (non-canonical NTP hydrolase)
MTLIGPYEALDNLADDCHFIAKQRGWLSEETQRNPLVLLALITSEVGEMVDAFRKPGPSEHCPELSNTEEEAADIIIRVLQMCAEHNLKIGDAVASKMAFNRTRPWKHGGKLY